MNITSPLSPFFDFMAEKLRTRNWTVGRTPSTTKTLTTITPKTFKAYSREWSKFGRKNEG